ncbi:hypothetical protein ACMFMF_011966 [Clarireedia jacksonii]
MLAPKSMPFRSSNESSQSELSFYTRNLFDFILKVLSFDQIGNIIIVFVVLLVFTTFCLLHRLVALSEFSKGGKGVWAKLVENTGNKLSEFLVFAVSVDSKGVRWDGGVNCKSELEG